MTDNSALLEEADRIEADMRSITLVASVDVAGLISRLAAALRSLEAEREGWVLVPATMTFEMQTAFAVAFAAPAPSGPNPTNSLDRMFLLAQSVYDAMLAARPSPPKTEREGWRDIASAPEGVEVLVYGDWLNSAETMPEWRPAPRAGIAYKSGSRSEPSSWCGESAGAHDEYIWWQPTHWIPLPSPPTAKTEEG